MLSIHNPTVTVTATMTTSQPFKYEESKLVQCALQNIHMENDAELNATNSSSPIHELQVSPSSSLECHDLFLEHQSFYQRSSSHSETKGRYDQFVHNVLFVHTHNQRYKSSSSSDSIGITHYVTLNQFSDMFDHELPYFDNYDSQLLLERSKIDMDKMFDDINDDYFLEGGMVKDIEEVLLPKHVRRHKKHGKHHHVHKLVVFQPLKSRHSKGWLIQDIRKNHYIAGDTKINSTTSVKSFPYDFKLSEDNWQTHLDWATEDNPGMCYLESIFIISTRIRHLL